MNKLFETVKNIFKLENVRKKVLFTLFMLLVFRFGAHIPVAGVDSAKFAKAMESYGDIFGLMDMFSGGAFKAVSIFAMSITPYINSSIIVQLLTIAIPRLERMQKEDEDGHKKINNMIRYGAIILAFFQATVMFISMNNLGCLTNGFYSVMGYISIVMSLTAGMAFLMWLGEQITDKGVGNGISLIIFAGIVSRGPSAIIDLVTNLELATGIIDYIKLLLIVVVFLAVIVGVICVDEAERKIPVQYAKRVVGRKMYGGQSTHIPIKVNLAGVIPIIFAMSLMAFPSTVVSLLGGNTEAGWVRFFSNPGTGWGAVGYCLLYAVLIIFFTFFYAIAQFNPIEVANSIKKNGGFIPGVRAGRPTADYLSGVLMKITWFGGLFLAAICILPIVLGAFTGIQGMWFGGSSVLIMVGVATETIKQIDSLMITRNYKGFLE